MTSWKEEFIKFANEVQEEVAEQGREKKAEETTPKQPKTEKAWMSVMV